MCKYFQVCLVLLYVWVTIYAFLLLLQVSGLFISVATGWMVVAGWLLFCFSSHYFIVDIWLPLRGKCRKPILEEEEKLQLCLRDVLLKASVDKTYRLMIEEEMALNAFAAGHDTIVVSRGFMVQLTEDELRGVLAHELGHLVSKDTIIASALLTASLLPLIMTYIYKCLSQIVRRGFFPSDTAETSMGHLRISRFNPLSGIAILLLSGYLLHLIHLLRAVIPVIAFVFMFAVINLIFNFLYLWVTRQIEYRQDAYAFRLGFGAGLRQALQKLTAEDPQPVNLSFIIFKSSHPVIYNRIRRLEKLEGLRA